MLMQCKCNYASLTPRVFQMRSFMTLDRLPGLYKCKYVCVNVLNEDSRTWDCMNWAVLSHMPRMPRDIIEHKLGLPAGVRPVKQKQRRYTPEKRATIQDEINQLLKAGFVWEVPFLEWLANPIMVKKPNVTWQMCMDYTDLNKVCPKDEYLLPMIDQIVDSTSRCELLCFLDAYSGYHQISMCIDDEEKLHL